MELTERQKREKEYYEQYAAKFDLDGEIDLAPVLGVLNGVERRPWNSYWRSYELPINAYVRELKNKLKPQLLDFGCGPGDNAFRFASAGFQISGFDISESNVEVSQKLFAKNQKSDSAHFKVGTAEELKFEDNQFEVVVGIDILHHVDIERSIKEVKRVLKKDGLAIFREPIESPFLDWVRNSWLVTRFVPNTKSLEAHITEDERKLNSRDVAIIASIFPEMKMEYFLLFSRFDKFIRKPHQKNASFLERVDYFLFRTFPVLKSLAGGVIFVLRK